MTEAIKLQPDTEPVPVKDPSTRSKANNIRMLLFPASLARWALVLLFVAGIYFFYGFIVPILAALVISVATWPLYKKLLDVLNQRRTIAATIALLTAIVCLVVPLGFLANYFAGEAALWVDWAVQTNREGSEVPSWLLSMPVGGKWLAEQWNGYIGKPGMIGEMAQAIGVANMSTLYQNLIATSGTILHILLTLVFILITLFFIYRDSPDFIRQMDRVGEHLFPGRWRRYSRIVPVAISSTALGMGVIAIGEGIILGTAYWIAGVPSPVMLGTITGFMALIPGGAPLSFTLVSIYLMASGSAMAGVLLFAWGTTELFLVDKFIRPSLVGRPMHLPFLPTFFGLIGGVKTMGFLGLFIGLALMALLVAIWREAIQELDEAMKNE